MTKRRRLEIEDYYGIDEIRELDLWQREFNIPPTEVAPIIFDHKGGIGAGVVEPNTSLDRIDGRGEEGFYIQCEGFFLNL